MYTLNPLQTYVEGEQYHDRDQTIEILMDDLDTEVMDIFYKRGGETADTATKVTTYVVSRPLLSFTICRGRVSLSWCPA